MNCCIYNNSLKINNFHHSRSKRRCVFRKGHVLSIRGTLFCCRLQLFLPLWSCLSVTLYFGNKVKKINLTFDLIMYLWALIISPGQAKLNFILQPAVGEYIQTPLRWPHNYENEVLIAWNCTQMAITPAHKGNLFVFFPSLSVEKFLGWGSEESSSGQLMFNTSMRSVCMCVCVFFSFFAIYHLNHKAEYIRQISDFCGFAEFMSH